MKKQNILLGMIFIWMAVIFILCAMPSQEVPDPGIDLPHLDKVVHFGMFFILSLLMRQKFEYRKYDLKTIYVIMIGFSFLYGGLIEILQHNFFNRGGDVWDLLADIAGAVGGCLSYPTVRKLKDRFLSRKRSSK